MRETRKKANKYHFMTFTQICTPIFDQVIKDYHLVDDVNQDIHNLKGQVSSNIGMIIAEIMSEIPNER